MNWTSIHTGATFESSFALLDKLLRRGELISKKIEAPAGWSL
jgi:hypothetical protein